MVVWALSDHQISAMYYVSGTPVLQSQWAIRAACGL